MVHLCTNSEYFSRQKVSLLSKAIVSNDDLSLNAQIKQTQFKFVCIGSVKALESNVFSNYKQREAYFRYASNQRQILSDSTNEKNVETLTRFSFIYDMLSTNHCVDIKKFAHVDMNEIELNNDLKAFEQSSFVLYCCARMNTILEKFDSMVAQGIYKHPLTPLNELNFFNLLKHDLEKKLCLDYLFKYEGYLNEIRDSLCSTASESIKLEKVQCNKLLKMVVDMSNLFSKYYSKIHILEVIFNFL